MIRIFHYARWQTLDDWLRLGWMVVNTLQGTTHGEYACYVEWKCNCNLVTPKKK
jgi:hypothetical protein